MSCDLTVVLVSGLTDPAHIAEVRAAHGLGFTEMG
jgi:hypothetical protein